MKNSSTKLRNTIIISMIAVAMLTALGGCLHKRQLVVWDDLTEKNDTEIKSDSSNRQSEFLAEFERSVMAVGVSELGDILISKLEDVNAIWANYTYRKVDLGIELDTADWINIVRALGNGIRNSSEQTNSDTIAKPIDWVYIKCNQCPEPQREVPMYLPAWDEFYKIIRDLAAKIKKEAGVDMLEKEYEKKFGTPISDLEFSALSVTYQDSNKFISVKKTATGAIVTDDIYCKDCSFDVGKCDDKCYRIVKLDNMEWLDFMSALYRSGITEWQDTYKTDTTQKNKWNVEVGFARWYNNLNLGSDSIYPPNWDDFVKLMEDMEVMIKEKIDSAEIKLKKGYAKRNMGDSLQRFERSAKTIRLNRSLSYPYYKDIIIRRTATGAIVTIHSGPPMLNHHNPTYNNDIDMEEWLDFFNMLHKYNAVIKPNIADIDIIREQHCFKMCDWEYVTTTSNCGDKDGWEEVNNFLIDFETRIKKGCWR